LQLPCLLHIPIQLQLHQFEGIASPWNKEQ
jgi:hypothetical protein